MAAPIIRSLAVVLGFRRGSGPRCSVALLTLALLFGCSTLERRVHFTPSADSGVLETEPGCADAGGSVLSGPADQIVVGAAPLRLEVHVPVKRRDISAGPFFLPIVPVFFMGWFFPTAFGSGDERQPLRAELRIVAADGRARLEAGGILALLDADGAPIAASRLESFVSDGGPPPAVVRSRGRWIAHFEIPRREVSQFRLEIRDAFINGRATGFPPIEWTRASGWVYCDNF